MSEWQPIDTAPKDGTWILAYGMAFPEFTRRNSWITADDSGPRIAHQFLIKWIEGWYDKEIDNGDGTYRKERTQRYAYWAPEPQAFRPTHWMPLPSSPEPPK